MELQQYLRILQRYWRSVVASVFLCLALAAGLTLLQKPTYQATSSIFISVDSGGTAGELSQGATYAERTVTSYVTVATTAMVLQPVIDELGLDLTPRQLANRVTVASPASTSIISVTARAGDPGEAAVLSNAISNRLLGAVDELTPQGPDGTQLVSATIIDSAVTPTAPSAPRPMQNLALGGLLGVLLGGGQAILRNVLDTRIRTVQDVGEITETPVLASIGHRTPLETGLRTKAAPGLPRRRTAGSAPMWVSWVWGGERRSSMVMTSAVQSEGKTETVVNLARVLAQAGESVLLIDADLRRPQVAAGCASTVNWGLATC